jgi:hypothetical protein
LVSNPRKNYQTLTISLPTKLEKCGMIELAFNQTLTHLGKQVSREGMMVVRALFILTIAIFVAGNLGILAMCLLAMAGRADEPASSAELAWVPAKDAPEL